VFEVLSGGSARAVVEVPECYVSAIQAEAEAQGMTAEAYFTEWLTMSLEGYWTAPTRHI
jgi:hypothetical protein